MSTSDSNQPPVKRLCMEDWLGTKWKLEVVLEDNITQPVPRVSVLVVEVTEKKSTASLIRSLNKVLPIPRLQHLKRVKSIKNTETGTIEIYLLLSEVGPFDRETVMDRLEKLDVDISGLGHEVKLELVASHQPVTRAQFDQLRSEINYWPTNFHEDKYIESMLGCTLFDVWGDTAKQLQLDLFSSHVVRVCGGGVVVDPGTREVVASGTGTRSHPLYHTALNLVDLVARSQGGGAMNHTYTTVDSTLYHTPISTVSNPPVDTVPTTGPYLLTGYDVYLANEPCHMCSMALLHSRVRRIFYNKPSVDGALTKAKLHTRPELNHKFQVFRVVTDTDIPTEQYGWCS